MHDGNRDKANSSCGTCIAVLSPTWVELSVEWLQSSDAVP